MGTVIVFASGKGGTGKTTCTGAVASALATLGKKVAAVDCDAGLKNLDLTLGLTDSALWDFSDVLADRTSLSEALVSHPQFKSLSFLPAPAGLSPEDIDAEKFSALIKELRESFDYVLLDSPAGIGAGFMMASSCADMAVVVSTGDSSSLRDGQKTVSILRKQGLNNIRLIVNRVRPDSFRRIKATVDDVIDAVGAQLIGLVSEDDSVQTAANLEEPLMAFGAKHAYDQFMRIARRITGERIPLGHI